MCVCVYGTREYMFSASGATVAVLTTWLGCGRVTAAPDGVSANRCGGVPVRPQVTDRAGLGVGLWATVR